VPASGMGYIARVDIDRLLTMAVEQDRVIRMELGIGEFVMPGLPLVSICRPIGIDPRLAQRLNAVFTIKPYRTIDQDAAFGIQQLVDVALKALSASSNDTTTATQCIDYITAVLARAAQRRIEAPYRKHDGKVRVIARGPTFADLLALSYDAIRRNARGNTRVLSRLIASAHTVAGFAQTTYRKRQLATHVQNAVEVVNGSVDSAAERDMLRAQAQATLLAIYGGQVETDVSCGSDQSHDNRL